MSIRLIVGLGNPGSSYTHTRHNIGYRVLDYLETQTLPPGLFLYRPESSFMNTCGIPIAQVMRKKGITPEQLLVICDDFAIPLGHLRIRSKGSSGGHNGLKSIFEQLGTQEIPRLRIGIGPVPEKMDPANFVLQNFQKHERSAVETVIEHAALATRCIAEEGLVNAMNQFNGEIK